MPLINNMQEGAEPYDQVAALSVLVLALMDRVATLEAGRGQ